MLARSKLNSIKSKISEAFINNEDFMTIINDETKYPEPKESSRMTNSQRSDTEKNNLIEEDKRIGINEVINNSLKP